MYNSSVKTTAIYLEDSYAKEMNAKIFDCLPEGNSRWRIILDQTVFYPMGGGQPTDQGQLISTNWHGKVYQVMMKDGDIWHYVESDTEPVASSVIHGVIDWDRRYKNMRVHSAGHVIDFAMYLLGYSPQTLKPTKGDHGKKPYIIYTGSVNKDIKNELEAKSKELVMKNIPFSTAFVPLVELEKEAIYLQPGLPANKPLRKLTLEGVGSVADGGTQVKNTAEVGKITIPSITEQDNNTTVAYSVD